MLQQYCINSLLRLIKFYNKGNWQAWSVFSNQKENNFSIIFLLHFDTLKKCVQKYNVSHMLGNSNLVKKSLKGFIRFELFIFTGIWLFWMGETYHIIQIHTFFVYWIRKDVSCVFCFDQTSYRYRSSNKIKRGSL